MNFGQIRLSIDGTQILATLTSGGWYCNNTRVANYLNTVYPPEIPSSHPDPWNALLDAAAADWQGEVVSRASPPER
jgi:hypothetical protein